METASADESVRRAAQRKASWRLIPLIALGYGAAYVDRVNISFASLQMNRDLHFSPAVYGLGAGLFFIPYALCEIPSNLLLVRFGARRWLARIMFTWGVIAMAMVMVRTPREFYIARFLLGMAEAGFFPGVIFYLMQWFPLEMRARTVSRFYVSLPLSFVFMGVLAGSLLNLNGRLGLAGWQWLFLVEGIPPVLLSVAFLFLLPDSPDKASWLTAEERQAILQGVRSEHASHSSGESMFSALRDSRVWQLGIFNLLMLTCSYAYTFVAPDLVQRVTHRNATQIGYVVAVMNLLGALSMLLTGRSSDRLAGPNAARTRFLYIVPCCLLVSAAFVGCGISGRALIVVPSLALLICAHMGMQGPMWAVPGSFLGPRSGAAGIAIINMIGIVGGFLGPYWIGIARTLTGDYQRGMLLMGLPMVLGAAIMLRMRAQIPEPESLVGLGDLVPGVASARPALEGALDSTKL